MWEQLTSAEARARAVLATSDRPDDDPALLQLARELAQARCSDWPFMTTRGKSPDYAHDRVTQHAEAATRLCRMLEDDEVDAAWVAERAAQVAAPADATPLVRALRGADRARERLA